MSLKEERDRLIKNLISEGYLKSENVINAFRDTPRENFVLPQDKHFAYADYPLQIGFGQTISAPHMVAIMTEFLEARKGDKVLEIGAGSGYQAAVLSKLVRYVYSIELDPKLVRSLGGTEAIEALVMAHNRQGGTLINMNVLSKEQIREAHADPSTHPDLMIRVTGYSAYFASLSREYRQPIVDRILAEP